MLKGWEGAEKSSMKINFIDYAGLFLILVVDAGSYEMMSV